MRAGRRSSLAATSRRPSKFLPQPQPPLRSLIPSRRRVVTAMQIAPNPRFGPLKSEVAAHRNGCPSGVMPGQRRHVHEVHSPLGLDVRLIAVAVVRVRCACARRAKDQSLPDALPNTSQTPARPVFRRSRTDRKPRAGFPAPYSRDSGSATARWRPCASPPTRPTQRWCFSARSDAPIILS